MLHAYGAKFVKRLRKLRVAIVGARGVGVEVAKCLTLSGVRLLHIYEDETVGARDLGSNFTLQLSDVGKPRAAATVPFLQRLNESVAVSAVAGLPDPAHYDVIVATRIPRAAATALNAACRASIKVRPWAVDEAKEFEEKFGTKAPEPQPGPCAFISADALGVAATIFSDFGPAHVVESVSGQPDIVANIKQVFAGEQTFIEVCNSDKRPVNDVDDGDACELKGVAGCDAAAAFVVANKKSVFELVKGEKTAVANLFELVRKDQSGNLTPVNSSAWPACSLSEASITFSKPAIPVTHKPLSEEDSSAELVTMDPFGSPSPRELLDALNAIESFRSSNCGALPRLRNSVDAAACAALAPQPSAAALAAKIASLADMELHGLASFIGGVCAQEVIKVTGLGIPLLGRFVHESLALDVAAGAFVARDDRYDDLRALLGQGVLDDLHNQRVFLVGAGALGCEFLKGFALAGVGTGPHGAVVVTDFLFRKEHVGALKSESAAASARAMNGGLKVDALSIGVGSKTEATFNDEFWTSKTLVVNALDNVPARRYVDSQCQLYKLSLLESGTEGAKANVQLVLKDESATYSEGKDPETEAIALCTLKEFPFAIEHTIQWAKVLIFNEEFSEAPSHARDFAENPPGFLAKIKMNGNQNGRLSDLRKTLQFIRRARTVTLESCVVAAAARFTHEFDGKIEATIRGKPRDAIDEKTGQLVWAPPKRFPSAIKFDHSDAAHCKFVAEFAALEAIVHGVPLPQDWSADSVSKAFAGGLFVGWAADGAPKPSASAEAAFGLAPLVGDSETEEALVAALEAEAQDKAFLAKLAACVSPQEFEKDDDTNHHIAFIASAANFRAANFSIPTVDEFRVKLIAGKIIAALSTTTTAVTGLVAVELLKVAAGLKVDSFKDRTFNLSDLSTMCSFEPSAPNRETCGAAAQRRAKAEQKAGQVAAGDADAAAALARNLERAKILERDMGLAGGFSLWDALTPPDSAQTVGQVAEWIEKEFKVRLVRLWFDTQQVQDSTDPENPDEGVMPIYARIYDELFPSLSKRDVRVADKLRSSLQQLQAEHPKKGIPGAVAGRALWRLSWECEDEADENAVFSVPSIAFKM